MPISDENHPEMIRAHQELLQQLGHTLGRGNKELDKHLVNKMFDIVKRHREKWRLRGVDFPVLVALVVPGHGIVEWVRADADISSIRVKIVNFVRQHPDVSMDKVVIAFRVAYPWLKPDDIAERRELGAKANERAEQRHSDIQRTITEETKE